jgi:hypothetical protein
MVAYIEILNDLRVIVEFGRDRAHDLTTAIIDSAQPINDCCRILLRTLVSIAGFAWNRLRPKTRIGNPE